jgi:TP901 family phage tail tape measure protein
MATGGLNMTLATGLIRVRVDMSGLNAQLQILQGRLRSVPVLRIRTESTALRQLASQLNALTGTIRGMGTAFAAAFAGRKIAGEIRDVVDTAADFETRMAGLRRVTGLQGQSLEKLGDRVKTLATTLSGVKIADAFDIATMGGRLGIAADRIKGFVRDISLIKVAIPELSAEETATHIERILNVFGKGPEDAIRFASALNQLDNTSTASAADILELTRRMAGLGGALQTIRPTQLLALGAAMKEAGITEEVGGTAFNQVISRMATDTAKFARIAGQNVEQFAKTLKGDPLAALQAFLAGLKKFDSVGQLQVLKGLHLTGARMGPTLLQLATVQDKLNGFVRDADKEWANLTSIQTAYNAQAATTNAQWARFENVLTVLKGKMGDALLPVVKALANSFSFLAEDVGAKLEANKGLIEEWSKKLTDAATTIGVAFNDLRSTWAVISEGFNEAWKAFIENLRRGLVYLKDVLVEGFTVAMGAVGVAIETGLHNIGVKLTRKMPQLNTPAVKAAVSAFSPAAGVMLDMLMSGKEGAQPKDVRAEVGNQTNTTNLFRALGRAPNFVAPNFNKPEIQGPLGDLLGQARKRIGARNAAEQDLLPGGPNVIAQTIGRFQVLGQVIKDKVAAPMQAMLNTSRGQLNMRRLRQNAEILAANNPEDRRTHMVATEMLRQARVNPGGRMNPELGGRTIAEENAILADLRKKGETDKYGRLMKPRVQDYVLPGFQQQFKGGEKEAARILEAQDARRRAGETRKRELEGLRTRRAARPLRDRRGRIVRRDAPVAAGAAEGAGAGEQPKNLHVFGSGLEMQKHLQESILNQQKEVQREQIAATKENTKVHKEVGDMFKEWGNQFLKAFGRMGGQT